MGQILRSYLRHDRDTGAMRDPANLVSSRARTMWLLLALVQVVVLAGAQVAWWLLDDDGSRVPHVVVAVITGALALTYLAVMPALRYRTHRWEVTDTAVYTQTGWLTRERRIAPISRVQTVDLKRGPVDQLVGLASVTVTTASARGPLAINGLDLATAQSVLDQLTQAAERERGDGT